MQWGKHGSLPRGYPVSTLPPLRTLNAFYAYAWLLPDFWLGNVNRDGPWCFCHSYGRYSRFTRAVPLGLRINAVVRENDPRQTLRLVFGTGYTNKTAWPPQTAHDRSVRR